MKRCTNLVHFIKPALVGSQLSHEGLVFEPFAVKVPCLIIRCVLSRQHLLIDPQSQLKQKPEDGRTGQNGTSYSIKHGDELTSCVFCRKCCRSRLSRSLWDTSWALLLFLLCLTINTEKTLTTSTTTCVVTTHCYGNNRICTRRSGSAEENLLVA